MFHLILILLWYIKATASESQFACAESTILPKNGLPFYKIESDRLRYSEAHRWCQKNESEILTLKEHDEKILTYPARMWISARRSNWVHQHLEHGLVINMTDLLGENDDNCVIVSPVNNTLLTVSCRSKHSVVCMDKNIMACSGDVFDYRCYYAPKNDTVKLQFSAAGSLCVKDSATLVVIHSDDQLGWLMETFSYKFWTGYQYVADNDEYYWPDGSVVTNGSWDLGQPGEHDCAITNEQGRWESSACDGENAFACTLEVPYASQRGVSCKRIDEECVCYWWYKDYKRFHKAMGSCLSDGGTLFYPNEENKMIYNSRYWIGVSQGYTPGVFRGSDMAAIKWANWYKDYPKVNELKDCVYVDNGLFHTEYCNISMKYMCQSKPDPKLYPCTYRRGCITTIESSWLIEEKNDMVDPVLDVKNVASFEECWTICLNYIGFTCLVVSYDAEAELCQLGRDTIPAPDSKFSTLKRERISTLGSSYCIKTMAIKANYEEALKICAGEEPGWEVPIIRDDVMQRKLANITEMSWINAKMTMKGIYKYDNNRYIVYSNWTVNQTITEGQRCVGSEFGEWYTRDCNDKLNVACSIYSESLCIGHLIITNGTVEYKSGQFVYTCDQGYYLPGVNATVHSLPCDCSWTEHSDAVSSCKAIECPMPLNTTNGTVITLTGLMINDTVVYSCRPGKRVYGTSALNYTLTCNRIPNQIRAEWSATPRIEDIVCSKPPPIPNASLKYSSTKINSVTTYTCHVGYRVTSQLTNRREFNITCTLDSDMMSAHWTKSQECEDTQCSEPPEVPHARLDSYKITVGDTAKYSCTSGYMVANQPAIITEFLITCLYLEGSAIWSAPSECKAMLCSEPPPLQNGNIRVNGYRPGDTATYICDLHYKLAGEGIYGLSRSEDSVCVFDPFQGFIWKPIPTCILEKSTQDETPITRHCPKPVEIDGATVHYTDTYVNSVVTYITLPGYRFDDGSRQRSIICLPNGKWGTYRGNAKRKLCPQLNINGASKSSEEKVPGTVITVTCNNRRARMENGLPEISIKCTESGKWSYTPKSCKVNRCKPFPYLERARLVSFNNTVGGLAVIECNEGTSFPDGQVIKSFRCLAHLDWEEPGLCLVNRCPSLNVPRNGTISTDIVLVGTVVDVKCLRGYMFPDRSTTKQVVCEIDLKWNGIIEDCEVLRCPDPPSVKNSVRSTNDTRFNSNITYICDTPYRMEYGFTEVTIRCQENASWTYASLSCDLGRCPPVPEIQNAQPDTRLATNGTTLIYTCNEGYSLPDNSTEVYIVCDGLEWNYTETACSKIKCPLLNLTHATWNQKGNNFGDVVEFICDEGYQYEGEMKGVLECMANSQWNGNTEGCIPKDCGPPPQIHYTTRNIPLNNVYGTVITYQCLERYWIEKDVRNTSIVCTKFGTWSEPAGKCTIITCPPVPVWLDIEVNTTDNVIGTAINISCSTEDGGARHFMSSHCTFNGEWEPHLDTCTKIKKAVQFEPKPEEAKASRSLGVIVISCMMAVLLPIILSDIPKIVRAMKGQFTAKTTTAHKTPPSLGQTKKTGPGTKAGKKTSTNSKKGKKTKASTKEGKKTEASTKKGKKMGARRNKDVKPDTSEHKQRHPKGK